MLSIRQQKPVIPSVLDGLGMGIGFTAALLVMGCIRELLGSGTIFGAPVTISLWINYYLYSCSGWILCLWYPSCYCKQINQRQKPNWAVVDVR
ncbi:MAG: Rnf-Nqr domain containing protein [Acutalibacteraceae bacterium]